MPALPDDDRYERFVSLFAGSEPALHSFVLSLLPNWSDAEEVMQRTSIVLWRKFAEFQSGSSFLAWARQIARYEALNYRKHLRRDRHVFSAELVELLAAESEDDAARLDAERRALAGCMDRLAADHREMIRRCYAGQETVQQVARAIGRTPNSLYKMLNRIRAALLECIRRRVAEGLE